MNAPPNFSSLFLALLALAGGLTMLVLGGDLLVAAAKKLARRWGMSSLLIGLTVVAFGTSTPELFVALVATWQNHPDIMAGNVVGSNIANIGLILGLSALLAPLTVRLPSIAKELYIILAATLLVWLITWQGFFGRPAGLVFVAVLIAYTFLSYRQARRRKRAIDQVLLPGGEAAPIAVGQPAAALLPIAAQLSGALLLLAGGSHFFIAGAADVARHLGISELVIGLTLAAVGTSLPELASSLAAIRRREGNLLLGNIIGSNLFNLLMVLGCSALLKPFTLSAQLFSRDLPVMFGFSAVLIPLLAVQPTITRTHGLLLLLAYGLYLYALT